MTLDDILAQVLEMLQRQGRVSYRALKRRFDINDDYIEALKGEILYVYTVHDDEGRGLIWTGDTESAHEVAAPPAQTIPQPVTQGQQSPEVTPRVTASPP